MDQYSHKFGASPRGSGEPILGVSHLLDPPLDRHSTHWDHQQCPRLQASPWLPGRLGDVPTGLGLTPCRATLLLGAKGSGK